MEREIRRWERRWLWLHGTRQAGRSLLTALLSAALLLGCGYLGQSIRENLAHIDRLYQTVQVTGELLQSDTGYLHGGGIVPAELGRQLEERGLFSSVTKVLGGSADAGDSIPALTGKLPAGKITLPAEEGRTVTDLIYRALWRMEDCPELRDGSLTLRTPEGEDFLTGARELRAAVSADVLETLGLRLGERIALRFGDCCLVVPVAGVLSGDVQLLLPAEPLTETLRAAGESWAYCVYAFDVDPARNRDLPAFRAEAETLTLTLSGPAELFLLLRDTELTQAVEPLERNVTLLRVLYPAALALSAGLAAGAAAMLTLQSRGELAILRLLGLARCRTGALAVGEVLIPALLGLLLGLAAAWTRQWQVLPGAGLLLLGSLTGSVGATAAILRKDPLALLQTKE